MHKGFWWINLRQSKRPLGRPRRGWEGKNKHGWEGVDWIDLALDRG